MAVEPEGPDEVAPLVRPPDVNRESNRSASPLELFFDLAFVLAIGRVGARLLADPTAGELAVCAGLVTLVWWAWASTALYANRFDTDDLVYRLLKLAGMLAVVVMAAGIGDIGGAGGRWFALAYGVLNLLLAGQYLRAWRTVDEARTTVAPYLAGYAIGGAVFLLSAGVPGSARVVLWLFGLGLQLAAPLLASTRGESPLHLQHLPERFGLFVILVFGESIASAVTGLEHRRLAAGALGTAALALAVAAALWWLYFDESAAAAKRGLLDAGEVSRRGVHDVYLFAHLPLSLALVALAVGLEQMVDTEVPSDAPTSARWLVAGGTAGFLASAGVLQSVLLGRVSALFPAGAAGAALAAVMVPGHAPVLIALVVLVAGVIAFGRREARHGRLPTSP